MASMVGTAPAAGRPSISPALGLTGCFMLIVILCVISFILCFLTHESLLWEKQHPMSVAHLEHILHPEGHYPSPQGVATQLEP